MRTIKIAVKTTAIFCAVLATVIFASVIYANNSVSDYYSINKGETLELDTVVPVRASICSKDKVKVDYSAQEGNTFTMDVKVLGVIPLKQINVKVVDELQVAVLGTPFGIKLYTEGVLVVGFTEIDSESGDKNPAKTAGLREGDFIVSLNGREVYTNEDVSSIIKSSDGELVVARISRNGKEKTISFYPARSRSSGVYRAGIWVKDSSAGIGTMTFYSPTYNVVAGLGHGICESETGTLMSLSSGEFVTASIASYVKGEVGDAGELKGVFTGKKIAEFSKNSENGVYGRVSCDINMTKLIPVALRQDVRNAKGYIYTTIDGTEPDYYTCNVKVRNQGSVQNLLVEVTDERLLSATGGIVQGMSGSPIIQNGKLIGAVTHVLLDDPAKGYGIFAETMLETAQSVTEENLKEAS